MKITTGKDTILYIKEISFCCDKISLLYRTGKIDIILVQGDYVVVPEQEKNNKNILDLLFFNYCPHCGSKIIVKEEK